MNNENQNTNNDLNQQITNRIDQVNQPNQHVQNKPIPRFEDAEQLVKQQQSTKPQQNQQQQQNHPLPRFEQKPINTKPVYQEVEGRKVTPTYTKNESYFDGKMLDLLGLKILVTFISILTLGLATPWVLCILYNYKYKHTIISGKRLKFEGKPEELFLEMFKWYFFSLITLGIYSLVIPERITSWTLANLHFEDEPFVKGDSYFTGSALKFIGVNILCALLTTISFGLLYAFSECFKLRWICNNSVINRKRIVFKGKSIGLFGNYILWGLATILTLGIYGLWLDINVIKWKTKNIFIKTLNQ